MSNFKCVWSTPYFFQGCFGRWLRRFFLHDLVPRAVQQVQWTKEGRSKVVALQGLFRDMGFSGRHHMACDKTEALHQPYAFLTVDHMATCFKKYGNISKQFSKQSYPKSHGSKGFTSPRGLLAILQKVMPNSNEFQLMKSQEKCNSRGPL